MICDRLPVVSLFETFRRKRDDKFRYRERAVLYSYNVVFGLVVTVFVIGYNIRVHRICFRFRVDNTRDVIIAYCLPLGNGSGHAFDSADQRLSVVRFTCRIRFYR